MRPSQVSAFLKATVVAVALLLLGAGATFAQQQVNLTAGPSSVTLPDGTVVPMWGYSCVAATVTTTATCAALNPAATGWSPVIITVPTGATGGLAINLTNNLPSAVPTSLVIVGQLGAGLGTTATSTQSPVHPPQGPTWPIAGDNSGPTFNPPSQGNRVQSFSTEVAPGATTLLPAWINLRPGTYLIESGTHPSIQGPMGLYGILVVTTAPVAGTSRGTAYSTPLVNYDAEVPLLFSEIDPVQNNAVNAAVNTAGFSETATRNITLASSLNSIAVTNGGSGYSSTPMVTVDAPGTGITATATATVDTDTTSPTYQQVVAITLVNPGSGYTSNPNVSITPPGGTGTQATAVSGLLTIPSSPCGGAPACYPSAVNYTPLYYLINGVAFNKTSASASLFAAKPGTTAVPVSGNVLVRMVNAGLRMHVPSIVGSQTGTAAASGFSLIAEDGNPLPGVPRVQSEVFMAAGKTYDVMINAAGTTLPVFDRELSLSGNRTARDAGMLAYIGVNGASLPTSGAFGITAQAVADSYFLVPGKTLAVSDPSKGVVANDIGIYGVQLASTSPVAACSSPVSTTPCVTLSTDGTFSYVPLATDTTGSFSYCGNGATSGGLCALVTLSMAPVEAAGGISCLGSAYTSNVATTLSIKPPGILAACKDGKGYPLTVAAGTAGVNVTGPGTLTLSVDPNGGFNASVTASGPYTFDYKAQNSQGTVGASATVTLNFPTPSKLMVKVVDGTDRTTPVTDYRWIIEEDRTFYIDPNCTTNPPVAGCLTVGSGIVPTFGTNFHTSYMPVVAAGCTGMLSCESGQTVLGAGAVCDVGNGVCRTDAAQQAALDPSQVHLDPTKRYYISVLPGDAANGFINANGSPCDNASLASGVCGHGMGGAPISPAQVASSGSSPVTILVQRNPFPPAKLSVFVFEDDFPLNGEHDAGGGIDVLATNEPGLGGFQITLYDDAGGTGDATGTPTYDMFNMPLNNSLAGMIDPATGLNACPISQSERKGFDGTPSDLGITGMIITCPKYEEGGIVLSPLAGQAVIANLYPGRYGVVATPAADRIAAGEEWLQTNTLDGQKAHDSFLRIGEPSFFQEFGPAGYHVAIGFANPKIINSRLAGVCGGTDQNLTGTNCKNAVKGVITTERMSRTPDERLYSSGDNSSFGFTQCYVSFGDPDGEDFAFTKCASDGSFSMSGLPDGSWRITVFDQWNDMLVDGLSTPVLLGAGATTDMGQIAMNQWQANIYTKTFFDLNGNGIQDGNEQGLTLVPTNIRFRDGSYSNFNNTDLSGSAGFNEIFPLFSWYVVESDSTRYKNMGTHVVYDAGGPSDGSTCGGTTGTVCGNSTIAGNLANTAEVIPVPSALRVPGAYYCGNADCTDAPTPLTVTGTNGSGPGGTTGRIDPPWVQFEGWQGFSGQNSFLEFGKKPFAVGETGGIHGEVIYASTRPFDDPTLLIHTSWTPDIPGVTINLYQEGTAPDGTQSLKLVDTTKTTSWDDWAQGFRSDGNPNMSCPGQGTDTGTNADLFYFSLYNQPMWLDIYNNSGTPVNTVPNHSQFKCYDGMHNWNQLQPAPYDGYYTFPSVTAMDPTTGKPAGTNCTACIANPDTTDRYRLGTPMLPAGKYVVEMIVPPGYELVKEEDKNILIGDNYIAPVTQQFAGLGNIFILPDQAEINALYNANNPQNPTQTFGRTSLPSHEGDTGSVEEFWPCVGASRIVPDYISLFPQSHEVSPFAGATRNLCDRKEIVLEDQSSVLAKFWIFSSTHVAAHFTGVITDDFTSEFDPFSPQFGEKFSPPNMPVSIKDWTGAEISRVYADHWGTYDGITYSTWEVNPPNPTGYAPTMMITCMNDPGTGPTPDPLYDPAYSQFCYETPFMPGQTQYMDTPVVPTSGFVGAGYNNPDCNYPDATPAIASVTSSDAAGPWVSASGHALTITALGDQMVGNYGYSGPSATTAPFNQKKVLRHYGFGGTKGTVSIGNVVVAPTDITTWTDTSIVVNVPGGLPLCAIQQQAQYGGPDGSTIPSEQCGELVITATNGKSSVDTVTVTVGGKQPTVLSAGNTIQSAIDVAKPGDLIIVPPGTYTELLIMWKPVRLQGVGAASSIINANTHPAGKLDGWRAQVNCLFGLALNGQPFNPATGGSPLLKTNPYDPSGALSCGSTNGTPWYGFETGANNPQVDRLPLEGVVGWDTTVNGNLAQLLQEPSLMGAYEGAGITVLSKGVRFPSGVEVFGSGSDTGAVATESQMPLGTVLLTSTDCATSSTDPTNPFPSNFQCNPSSIDGVSITNSSQGGGGVFLHAWAHNIQIANNRIYNNTGTISGGINVGQGESPDALLVGNNGDPVGFDQQPWTCNSLVPGAVTIDPATGLPVQNVSPPGFLTDQQLPYCYNVGVNVHHNAIRNNSSIGDELFSATPAGAGGVTFCTGADNYKFNYNWLCGNLSTGDGGGLVHLGFSLNGDIEHNSILFNQSTNPTIPTNGGGVIIMTTGPDGSNLAAVECGSVTDVDCAPGLGDGTGPGLVINANLIMGNAAESGSGGGLRLQGVNGTEVIRFPKTPAQWYTATVTNNIIANNVAGWDGAGVSLQDSLAVNFINNSVIANDTTASSGVLFNTLGAPLASSLGTNCIQTGGTTASCPQPAGLVSVPHSAPLTANLPAVVTCPGGHPHCTETSFPVLDNNVFWHNQSYYIGVGSLGTGTQNQQNVVALYNAFTGTPAGSQLFTGACVTNSSIWDLGVRGDTGPGNHGSGVTLAPRWSVLTSTAGYGGTGSAFHNLAANPGVVSQYCNGSRVPPENGGLGYQVPPGISDATVPNPIFNLTPAATVDEGNNWINISWGPLSLTNPNNGAFLGNYALASSSPAIDYVQCTGTSATTTGCLAAGEVVAGPTTDFFGNQRGNHDGDGFVDAGAVEFQGAMTGPATPTLTSINPNSGLRGTSFTVFLTGTNLGAATSVNVTAGTGTGGVTATLTSVSAKELTATFNITSGAAFGTRNITVTASGITTTPAVTFTVSQPTLTAITPATGYRGTTVPITITGNLLTGATAVTLGGNITCTITGTPTATQVTASCVIGTGAAFTTRNVTVTTPSGVTPVSAAVTFTVLHPSGGVSPTSLVFGSQQVGTSSASQPVTLSNTAGGPLTIGAITITGGNASNFGQTNNCVSPLAVGANCTINVTFTPSAAGLRSSTMNIALPGATVTPITVPLSGTGIAPSATLTGTAAFGSQQVGTTSAAHIFTYTNAGLGAITVSNTGVTLTGTNASNYAITSDTCIVSGVGVTLAPSGTCTIGVAFTPNATGSRTATLNVADTAGGAPTQAANLTGTGIQAAVGFTWTNGGTVGAWGTATGARTITVTNTGNAGSQLSVTAVPAVANLTGGTQFSPTGGTCSATTVLNQNQTCTVIINRTRPGVAPFAGTGTLTVTDTGAATTTQVLNVSGT